MAQQRKTPSPMLGAAMAAIGEATEGLVAGNSRFRHSFEAPLARVRSDPDQPRKRFDDANIAALAATMQAEGQLQPVLVRRDPEQRGAWILVAGERRWRAAQFSGWSTILAIEHTGDADLAALLENLQRIDLTPVEEARGLQRLLTQRGVNQATAAEMLGRSPAEVSASLRLLTLPPAFLEQAADVPRNVLVELARLKDGPVRDRLMQMASDGSLTVRAIRDARAAAPPPPRRPPLTDYWSALERMTLKLERRKAKGEKLSEAERHGLMTLRTRIEALLEF
ncbi:ParB/RepB/Spo0J family partition protein [Roseomonas nepalensis]|uniref:ParB/RepB/Spo0J family partition protein n=1 Tax=Muricoccus nepalensis TaxID=1854500 RepID=A0A502FAV3_9PROT|nr:ParB/RepB/Spo0J family partition protein [Roseomonas nepalensis]TPG46429.1 ParB/RepB/Spo0J family partition protein [Roseomonas nepalensis]